MTVKRGDDRDTHRDGRHWWQTRRGWWGFAIGLIVPLGVHQLPDSWF